MTIDRPTPPAFARLPGSRANTINALPTLPVRIGFALVPRFSLITLASGIEPLRMTNERSGSTIFAYRTLGVTGLEVEANDGMRVTAGDVIGGLDWDIVFLVASLDAIDFADAGLANWLRRLVRAGVMLAPVGAGTVIAARLGLLDGHQCVTHWRLYNEFLEMFPAVRLGRGVYSIDRQLATGAGGAATMDLALRLVADFAEPTVAAEVAEIAQVSRIRQGTETQRMSVRWRYGISDERVVRCVETMESNIEEPVSLDQLASFAGISVRQMERLFQQTLGHSPKAFYMQLRLQRAHQLLVETSEPIFRIALKTGFCDAAHLSTRFRAFYGSQPLAVRRSRDNPLNRP